MMTPTTSSTTYPVPVGELLEQLRADGFVVTPDTYRRMFAVVDAFYPDGLPAGEDGQPQQAARNDLSQLLGPVVARNEDEQERFTKRFAQLLTPEPDVLPPPPPPPPLPAAPFPGWLIAQLVLLALTGGWLVWLVRSGASPKHIAEILTKTINWQTRSFQLDSLTASRVDTIWWDLGDDTRFVIGETGPVTHSYRNVGDYQISASWRNGTKRDSARIMTKIVDDDPCRLDFKVVSRGNSYTFVNQSPGLQKGFAYRFDFGDGTSANLGKRISITHTYADDSRQYAVRLTALTSACGPVITQYVENIGPQTFSPTFVDLRRMPDSRSSWLTLLWWLPFVLIGSGATAAGLVLMNWFRRQNRPEQPNAEPPYDLTFPDQSAGIRVGASMDDWAQQLLQRDEGSRRLLDVSKTVLATARRGGYPTVAYRRMKSRPRYVVLIDHRSARHQQAQLYSFLTTVLIESDVEVEPFYFHTDPRYCWNETYPKGLTIETLYRLHAASSLVLITEGTRLIDYEEQTLAAWVPDLLGSWANRAILTPVYPENWNVIEAILSEFFVVLPATPDGQLLLRTYFQSETLPTFADLRQTFGVSGSPEGRGIFGKSLSTITLAEVRAFLEKSFPTESIDANQQKRLWQWACATAVYPTPNYDITVAIGKAIEDHTHTQELVTTSNLLKLTALPHLKQSAIPDDLQDALLAELPPDIERVARRAVLKLLDDPNHQPPSGSRAETDRNLHRWMQWLLMEDPDKRQEALRELRPYQQAGYITNRLACQVVENDGKQQRQRYSLGLAVATVILMSVASYWSSQQPPKTQVASWVQWAYVSRSEIDSAAFYNNRAVGRLDTARTTYDASMVATNYEPALQDLTKSLRHRASAEALQNLHALRYNRAWAYWQTSANQEERLQQQTLSPLGEVPTLMAPIRRLDPNWVPTDSTLMQYLMLIITAKPAADVYALLTTKGTDEFNRQPASQSVTLGAAKDTTGFAGLVFRAQRSYNLAHINLLVRPATDAGRNVFRIRLYDTTAINPATLDRLIPLETARILLYYDGPREPAVIRPAPATVPASSAVRVPIAVKKLNKGRRITKTPNKVRGKQPPVYTRVDLPDYSPRKGRVTSPTYSLTSVQVKWDPKLNNPVTRRGLTEPYGVLIGNLIATKAGEDGIVYLQVVAQDESYRVALDLSSQVANPKSQRQQTQKRNAVLERGLTDPAAVKSPLPEVAYRAVVWQIPQNQLSELRAYQLFKDSPEGFYPVDRANGTGALDYLRSVSTDENSRTIKAQALVNRLLAAVPVASSYAKQPVLTTQRVLIWGSRWRPENDDEFGLPAGFYEIRNVHLNQGYAGENARLNAPWQDGGLVLIANQSKKGSETVAYMIRLVGQTLSVDDNGDPLRAATAK